MTQPKSAVRPCRPAEFSAETRQKDRPFALRFTYPLIVVNGHCGRGQIGGESGADSGGLVSDRVSRTGGASYCACP